jgi:hypothetical protein
MKKLVSTDLFLTTNSYSMVIVSQCSNYSPSSNIIQNISDLRCHLGLKNHLGVKIRSIFRMV